MDLPEPLKTLSEQQNKSKMEIIVNKSAEQPANITMSDLNHSIRTKGLVE